MKKILFTVTLAGLFALAATLAMAAAPSQTGPGVNTMLYHSYDGLVCADCHTMHFSEGGTTPTGADAGGPWQKLLKKKTNTDICLGCHTEGSNAHTTAFGGALAGSGAPGWVAPIVKTLDGGDPSAKGIAMPAGDFYFSDVDPAKGHNPSWTNGNQAASMTTDPVLAATFPPTIPGLSTSYIEQDWDCHTCHGMHNRFSGSYTAWRQLKRKINGVVESGDVSGLGVETTTGNKGATAAGFEPLESNSRGDIQGTSYVNLRKDGDPLEGADLWTPYSATNKNVYRGGFSSFCSVCHGNFHGGTETSQAGGDPTSSTGNTAISGPHWFRHPTNVALDGPKYNASKYTVTVTNTQGTNPNPPGYDWKYPLRRVAGTWTVTNVSTAGEVSTSDKVMCLTCHYAHAGPEANSLRWNEAGMAAFIANGATDSYHETSNGDNPAYGCNKCHQKGGAKAFVKSF